MMVTLSTRSRGDTANEWFTIVRQFLARQWLLTLQLSGEQQLHNKVLGGDTVMATMTRQKMWWWCCAHDLFMKGRKRVGEGVGGSRGWGGGVTEKGKPKQFIIGEIKNVFELSREKSYAALCNPRH